MKLLKAKKRYYFQKMETHFAKGILDDAVPARLMTYKLILIVAAVIAVAAVGTTTMGAAQIANAQGNSDNAYGKSIISGGAQCESPGTCVNPSGNSGNSGNWGGDVSSAARDEGPASTHNGLGDWRSNGCKVPDRGSGSLC